MSSELVQTGFFDLEDVRNAEPIQVTYDYSRVTPEQANKLQTIHKRILVRHAVTSYEDGRDLLEAQSIQGLPYSEFITWAKACYGWSERTINNKMNAALYWGDFTAAAAVIEDQAVYVLSSKRVPESVRQEAKALLNAGESIDEERAKQLRDAERARRDAEKKAEEKERELILFKQEVERNEQSYTALVQSLEQKLEEKPEPEKVIEYQDTLETAAKVASLEQQVKALEAKPDISPEKQKELDNLQLELKNAKTELDFYTTQNEALAKEINEHREAAGRSLEDATALAGRLRIRQVWQYATDEIQAALRKFHTCVPSELDRGSFEGEEHTRTAQTIDLLIETAMFLKKTLLGSDSTVDADISTTAIVQHQPAISAPAISDDYQALFAHYQRYVKSYPDEKLWWRAPNCGIKDMEMDRDLHITYTRELLKSGDPYRITAAIEGMKQTLGYGESYAL